VRDERGSGDGIPPDRDDVETGEPIAALSGIEVAPSPGFLARLRNRIERRTVTSQVASFAWHVPVAVLYEFLSMVFAFVGPQGDRKGGSR
jgi:hypothetical protein